MAASKQNRTAGLVDISAVIAACRFGSRDVEFATTGQCASFAMALHDALAAAGVVTRLAVVADADYLEQRDRLWAHVLVNGLDGMFDIRGRVGMHDNRMFGTHLFPIGRTELEEDVAELKRMMVSLYDCTDRYRRWRRLLSAAMPTAAERAGETAMEIAA